MEGDFGEWVPVDHSTEVDCCRDGESKKNMEEKIKRNGDFCFWIFLLGHFFLFLNFCVFCGCCLISNECQNDGSFFLWPKKLAPSLFAILAQKAQRSQLVCLNRCAR